MKPELEKPVGRAIGKSELKLIARFMVSEVLVAALFGSELKPVLRSGARAAHRVRMGVALPSASSAGDPMPTGERSGEAERSCARAVMWAAEVLTPANRESADIDFGSMVGARGVSQPALYVISFPRTTPGSPSSGGVKDDGDSGGQSLGGA